MRIALAIFISTLALTAQADGIYKWTDENGVVHFGSQPPQEKKNDDVEVVRKPKSERYKQWQAEQQALMAEEKAAQEAEQPKSARREEEKQDGDTQPEENRQPSRAEMAVRAQRCRMARDNLQELTTHSRVREIGSDGKMRVLPEEERQQRITQMQRTIRDNC
ncbi:DUF4124 domain-containing protein [Microbulbifer litoralis]|uniref:DUF4124 domain-containing protein n=1 Tax=Microbulbifer litoralis TaxID=2933965 RepID=UPI002028568E|nr:DUF4124 domain-containing protein [Microbulbifer sp. GX H0434]